MAGTRLAVHAVFVVQLFALVAVSFLYALYQDRNDLPLSSADPFVVDRSGWEIIVEDLSLDDGAGLFGRASESLTFLTHEFSRLLGIGTEKSAMDKSRPSAVFVQEMRQLSQADMNIERHRFPTLRMKLKIPTLVENTDSASGNLGNIANALRKGLQQRTGKSHEFEIELVQDVSSVANSCDDWRPPITNDNEPSFRRTRRSRRRIRHPEIIVLTGCTREAIPDPRQSLIEIGSDGDIILRTIHNSHGVKDQVGELNNELQEFLENEFSKLLYDIISPKVTSSSLKYKLGRISIQLIDENPTNTNAAVIFDEGISKLRQKKLGRALSSSIEAAVNPILDHFSFIYGGDIDVIGSNHGDIIQSKGGINVLEYQTALLELANEILEPKTSDELENNVSAENLAKWIYSHSKQNVHRDEAGNEPDAFQWLLFIPSVAHSPLIVHDTSGGNVGHSITLSQPHIDGGRDDTFVPAGMTIIDRFAFPDETIDLEGDVRSYDESISKSFGPLVAYIRALHGLPPSMPSISSRLTSSMILVENPLESKDRVSFWELEYVARSHWHYALEQTLQEMDSLISLLHRHANTLAVSRQLAGKINKATSLLRQSITVAQNGYPLFYATSLLYGSSWQLQDVRNDPDFMELSYFAPDHYLAVFSPLVLPLLLPMILGLVREVKRYNELKMKRPFS